MEGRRGHAIGDLPYLARACELARRAVADAAPNPPVGAVIVREMTTLGEGYHHRHGEAHAEVEALSAARSAGCDPRGATAYVSLEPCNHTGRTGPCTQALIAAGIARVVIGARDPNPIAGGGVERLRAAGIGVDVVPFGAAQALIERFVYSVRETLPFLTLKMAMSLDGAVAPRSGERFAVTGAAAAERVRELRCEHDAVLVGAGTVRIDDPRLTLRPHRTRTKRYLRIVACQNTGIAASSRVLGPPDDAPPEAYAATMIVVPGAARERFASFEQRAEIVYIGDAHAHTLDLRAALQALRERNISSILCEGGPTLAGALLADRLVQRAVWFVAPRFLQTPAAVPVVRGAELSHADGWRFDEIERLGEDLMIQARVQHV